MRRVTILLAFSGVLLWALPSVRANDEPTPFSIIDAALKAGGGVEKIQQFKAVSFRAEVSDGSKKSKEKVLIAGTVAEANLFRIELKHKKSVGVMVVGGDTVWVKQGKKAFEEYPFPNAAKAGEFDCKDLMLYFYAVSLADRLLALKAKEYTLSIEGEFAVAGTKTVALRAKHLRLPDALIYFDKETALPVKAQLMVVSPTAENEIGNTEVLEFFFDNYKTFDGVLHFTRLKIRASEHVILCDLSDIKLLTKVDRSVFTVSK